MHAPLAAPPLQPTLEVAPQPPTLIGNCKLATAATRGDDLAPIWNALVGCVHANPMDAGAYLDLSTIAFIQGRLKDRIALRTRALELSSVFRLPAKPSERRAVHVAAFVAVGDYLPNMPIEFLLDESEVTLDLVYVTPGKPLPPLPEHDVAFVAVAESTENQPLLAELAATLHAWPRPVLNRAERIAPLTRDGTWALLNGISGLEIPVSVRVSREQLEAICRQAERVADIVPGTRFPIVARPLDTHLGDGLCKLDDAAAVETYLRERTEAEFHVSPFVDYRSLDGLYRKYRVALIDGRAYAVHMAVAPHWMINYVNANMGESAEKRAEEARFMEQFDDDFALRHAGPLQAICERTGLDYLPFDCGETPDGRLLLFELGTNMIVHAMDPVDVYPYKRRQMEKVFGAFKDLLCERSNAHRRRCEQSEPIAGLVQPAGAS